MASGLAKTVVRDIVDGVRFISQENRRLGKVLIIVALFCVTLSPILSVALPTLATIYFDMGEDTLGLTQGMVVFGGTVGVVLIGLLGKWPILKKHGCCCYFAPLLLRRPALLLCGWAIAP
jgi:hypothetical protein